MGANIAQLRQTNQPAGQLAILDVICGGDRFLVTSQKVTIKAGKHTERKQFRHNPKRKFPAVFIQMVLHEQQLGIQMYLILQRLQKLRMLML